MNRKQRRKTARGARRTERRATPTVRPDQQNDSAAVLGKPSLLLRIVAFVVLSRWVLKRVRHPSVRATLAAIARQVGRDDLAADLEG